MRSVEEQFAGLHRVARRAMARQVNLALAHFPGDVVTLTLLSANPSARQLQVVYAAGGYDLWEKGALIETDLSEESAAEILVREYLRAKAELVLTRRQLRGREEQV
jgi:hypothetical protein